MPEPDFNQIARTFLDGIDADFTSGRTDQIVRATVEQLRQIWNARGAADAQAVSDRIRDLVAGEVIGAGIARHVIDAIRIADR